MSKDIPAEVSPDTFDAPVKWTIHDTYAIVGYGICFISGGLFSPIGIVFSLLSLKAKQKHRWISFWGLASNIFFLALWISLIIVFFSLKIKVE